MKKVSIKLQGGLGNMLFQIATTYAYAQRFNKECVFTTDDSVTVHKHINYYKNNILREIEFVNNYNFNNFSIYSEPHFHYKEIPNFDGDVYLSGYFQSEKYFSDYKEEIKKIIKAIPDASDKSFKESVLLEYGIGLSLEKTCSIHVRRGDYVGQPQYHPTQEVGYYMKAAKKIGMDNKFLVFSDDIKWCKENFPEMDNFIFIEGLSDYEDFCLMSLCNHNIICNSSFSWWAAWLNENKEKIVVAPKKWFGNAYSHFDTKDIYCENWIVI